MLPFGAHHDGVLLLGFIIDAESVLLALQDELVGVVRMQGGQDSEEVFTRALAAFGILIGKIVGHIFQRDALVVQIGHGDLVVPRRVALPGVFDLQELLIAADDLLEPFGVQHVVWWHVILSKKK